MTGLRVVFGTWENLRTRASATFVIPVDSFYIIYLGSQLNQGPFRALVLDPAKGLKGRFSRLL